VGLYHRILGVPEGAPLELVKERYRALCKRYHPDLNDQASIGKMALINEAYAALARSMPGGAEGEAGRGSPADAGLALCKDQAYAFYKQGVKHYRLTDDNLVFRDDREWNKETRRFDKTEAQAGYERDLYRALHYFNLVCSEYPDSEWAADSADKIRLLNQKRGFLERWRARFGA
jgi:hypothetical protein